MVKGTTAVFIVPVVVPVTFVQRCLLATAVYVLPSFTRLPLKQTNAPILRPERINFGPEIFLVLSVHLIVVTQDPLVLECFVTNNPHNSHRLKDNSLII